MYFVWLQLHNAFAIFRAVKSSSDHHFEPIHEAVVIEPVDISDLLEQLDNEIKMAVIDVQSET